MRARLSVSSLGIQPQFPHVYHRDSFTESPGGLGNRHALTGAPHRNELIASLAVAATSLRVSAPPPFSLGVSVSWEDVPIWLPWPPSSDDHPAPLDGVDPWVLPLNPPSVLAPLGSCPLQVPIGVRRLGADGRVPAPPRKVTLMLILKPQDLRAARPSNPPAGLKELARERPGFRPGNLRQSRAGGRSAEQAGRPGNFGRGWEWPGIARFLNNSQAVHMLKVPSHTQRELLGAPGLLIQDHTPNSATGSQRDPDFLKPKLAGFSSDQRPGMASPLLTQNTGQRCSSCDCSQGDT